LFRHYFLGFGLVFGAGGFDFAWAGFAVGAGGFLGSGASPVFGVGGIGVLSGLSPLKFSTSFINSVLSITDFNFAPNVFESCSNQVAISFFCLLTWSLKISSSRFGRTVFNSFRDDIMIPLSSVSGVTCLFSNSFTGSFSVATAVFSSAASLALAFLLSFCASATDFLISSRDTNSICFFFGFFPSFSHCFAIRGVSPSK